MLRQRRPALVLSAPPHGILRNIADYNGTLEGSRAPALSCKSLRDTGEMILWNRLRIFPSDCELNFNRHKADVRLILTLPNPALDDVGPTIDVNLQNCASRPRELRALKAYPLRITLARQFSCGMIDQTPRDQEDQSDPHLDPPTCNALYQGIVRTRRTLLRSAGLFQILGG